MGQRPDSPLAFSVSCSECERLPFLFIGVCVCVCAYTCMLMCISMYKKKKCVREMNREAGQPQCASHARESYHADMR